MPRYETDREKFAALDAQVVGISVDSVWSHVAWQQSLGGLNYPLASDFYPHGNTAQAYGVFRPGPPMPGISERAIFIVNKEGKIVFARTYALSDIPNNEELLEVLRPLHAQQQASLSATEKP